MKRLVLNGICALIIVGAIFTTAPIASAASFNPSRVIDDGVLDNSNTMTIAQVDAFLNSFPSSCLSTNNGFTALDPIGYSPSSGYSYGGNVSAGTIIVHAAQAYDINPQVLLTTLQKEQSLVSGGAGCSTLRYTGATGYGCPDSGTTYNYSGLSLYTIHGTTVTSVTGTCVNSALKAGFTQQLIRAAWLLKFGEQRSEGNISWAIIRGNWNNSDDPQSCYSGPMTQGTWAICPSGQTVYYDGYQTIDGSPVFMSNGATASLYWYTPHFSGNQSFFNTFTSWFGLPYANDTTTAHPNGTLILESNHVYLINNGQKDYIQNAEVFNSYHYRWSDVKTETTGDINLGFGPTISTFGPGTLFTAPGQPVYVMNYDTDGTLKKQHISYDAFNALGYHWNDVMNVDPSEVPAATFTSTLFDTVHPSGTLVKFPNNPRVYMISQGTLQYVVNGFVFDSYEFYWSGIRNGTSGDAALPAGTDFNARQGTIAIANGNIYVIDYSGATPVKRPLGPWECYADRLHYSAADWLSYDIASLPSTTGSIYTC
jgi:hypothetical protein